jgi:hypothetical protein
MNFKEAYPHLLKYWDKKKNIKSPEDVHSGTRKYEAHFICKKGHLFSTLPCRIKYWKTKDLNCSICNNGDKPKLFKDARPYMIQYWDYERNIANSIDINTLTRGSNTKCYFKCNEGHEVIKSPASLSENITEVFNCNVCSGVEVVKSTQLDNAYPDIANEWSLKNKKSPSEVSCFSDKEFYWTCENDHTWKTPISARTGHRHKGKQGTRCPYCWQSSVSRNELILFSELHQFFDNVISTKKIKRKHLDIFIEDINLAVEYDGVHWHKDKIKSDKERNIILKNEGVKTIRVRESSLPKIENQDILYDNVNTDLFFVIIDILNFIKSNYKLKNEVKNKINNYIINGKISNQDFFEKNMDNYRIKKITDKKSFLDYDVEKNKLPLHYYGIGSDYNAFWKCNDCCCESREVVRKRISRVHSCKKCREKEIELNKKNRNKYKSKKKSSVELSLKIKNTHSEILCELPQDRLEELQELNYTNTLVYFNSTCFNCSHIFKTNLWNKTKGQSCPNCNFSLYKKETSLLKDYPFLTKIYSKKNTIDLKYTKEDYVNKVFWKCSEGHVTKESILSKIKYNECVDCYSGVFAIKNKRIMDTWDWKKNNKNKIYPDKIKTGFRTKVAFKCERAKDHEWEAAIYSRKTRNCPFCGDQRLSITNRFDLKYPEIADMWSKNNNDSPDMFMFGYKKSKHLWSCNCCGKEFPKEIGQMIRTDASCPLCQHYNVGEHKGVNRRSVRSKKKSIK